MLGKIRGIHFYLYKLNRTFSGLLNSYLILFCFSLHLPIQYGR
jgi:hypothetical protein